MEPRRLTLEELWDLEDEFTPFVGRPSGASSRGMIGNADSVRAPEERIFTARVAEDPSSPGEMGGGSSVPVAGV